MNTAEVREHFRAQVADYPALMKRLVPFYDEQRDVMLDLIPLDRNSPCRFLDLGCGPGLVSARILSEYPHAELTAFDMTRDMLDACRARVGDNSRATYRLGDFRIDDFGGGYGVIVASLALHHATLLERPRCLQRLFDALAPGGVLVAAEVILDESPAIQQRQYELWRTFMARNGEDGDHWFDRHRQKDHPAPISTLTSMLLDAGFATAGCFWRYLNFAILVAEKA